MGLRRHRLSAGEQAQIALVRDYVMRGRDYRGCRACVLAIPGRFGYDTWAHMAGKRRSQTRNMAPTDRHCSQYSMRLCQGHHTHEEAHRLLIEPLTDRGADGPCRFTFQGRSWEER